MIHINTESVTIMLKLVGTACNMRCIYCYEHVSKQNRVGLYFNIDEVKSYLNKFKIYKHVFIVFHGGEPLLSNITMIKEVLKYIFSTFNYSCSVQFQTNGTLINNEWLALFQMFKDRISLSISLDPKGDSDLRLLPGADYRTIVMQNIKNSLQVISNVGIISVANKYNKNYFLSFIEQLIGTGIRSLTINKCQGIDNTYTLSEAEYVEILKKISIEWIRKRWYRVINIQPLNSLFNDNNRLCIYLPNESKCYQFKTYYSDGFEQDYCDHIINLEDKTLYEKCNDCDIYNQCGGGCLVEQKNQAFCDARRELFLFIERLKNGY